MDVQDALVCAQMLKAELVVPMHFKTWPLIEADPQEFCALAQERGINAKVLNPGETLEF
jgi:L-ascorbate metabolism protein UlaG (beta-lactamase superfamily)